MVRTLQSKADEKVSAKTSSGPPICILVLLLSSIAILSAAVMKSATPKGYICYRTTGPINIDGKLDEVPWQSAAWTDLFVDIEGDAKPRPRLATRARMLWDDQYFYVGAEMEEPHVWATLTKRDSVIFHDNDFEIFIDPDGDNHEYYELEINALNTVWDLFLKRPYRDGGPAINGWDIAGLKTAVHTAGTLNDPTDIDEGWSVELALPWKALAEYAHRAAPPADGDQWRINFSRVQWQHEIVDGKYRKVAGKKEDNWVWSPQGVIDMHRPERWGYIQFSIAQAGKAQFKADETAPVGDLLRQIYYAQRDYKRKHGIWAATLEELRLADIGSGGLTKRPIIQTSKEGYQVTAEVLLPGGKIQLWHIRQDSRIWAE